MPASQLIEHVKRINAIAELGLLYSKTDYDTERYKELQLINLEMMSLLLGQPVEPIAHFFTPKSEYPTAKVDIRGFVLNDENEILLVREQSDGCWSLPGGWADVGFTPSEIVVKEIFEETGLNVKPKKLLAVFDKKCHPHPPELHYIYKIIIQCEIMEGWSLQQGFDILGVGFFPIDQLPALSVNRIVAPQIHTLYQRILANTSEALFD